MDNGFIETLHTVILKEVQKNVNTQLIRELDTRHTFTGHSLIMRNLDDVKRSIEYYAKDEMETATKRLYLLMGV